MPTLVWQHDRTLAVERRLQILERRYDPPMPLSNHNEVRKGAKLLSLGARAFNKGSYGIALARFEECLALGLHGPALLEAAGYAAARGLNWVRAEIHWQALCVAQPQRLGPARQYFTSLLKQNKADTAEAFCRSHALFHEPEQKLLRDNLIISCHLAQSKVDAAIELAETTYSRNPSLGTALQIAHTFVEGYEFDTASAWLQRVPKDSAINRRRALILGHICYVKERWQDSKIAFLEVTKTENRLNPERLRLLLPSLADVNGRVTTKVLDLGMMGPVRQVHIARIFLARIAAKTGRLTEATFRYRRVFADEPENPEALGFLIRSALASHDGRTALDLIAIHGQVLSPAQRIGLQAKATALLDSDPDAGLSVIKRSLQVFPNDSELRLSYARSLLDADRPQAALAETDRVILEDPENINGHRLRLRLLQTSGADFEAQLRQAQRLLHWLPSDVNLLNTVGSLLIRLDRRTDAFEHFKASVEIVPDAPVLWRQGSHLLMMENRAESAAEFARNGVRNIVGDSAEDIANSAWILQSAQLYEEAWSYIERSLRIDPSNIKALETGVDLLMLTGRYREAWTKLCRLDSLVHPRRSEKLAHAGAQCVAAFRTLAAAQRLRNGSTDASNARAEDRDGSLFPEALFYALVDICDPLPLADCHGILQHSATLGSGGAERQVAHVMQGLVDSPLPGETCVLVVNSLDEKNANDFYLGEIQNAGGIVIELEAKREASTVRHLLADKPEHAHRVRALASMPTEITRVAIPFYAQLVTARPRVVQFWQDSVNVSGGIAAVAAGVPQIVLCARSTRPTGSRRYRRYLRDGYLALLKYRGQVCLLNNSAYGARDYEDWLGLPAETVGIFRNGYDFAAMRERCNPSARSSIRKDFGIPQDASVIGGVMRFSPEKRPGLWVDTVIAATSLNESVHGLIVGEGHMRQDLMRLVEKLDLSGRIHFAGRQSPIEPWMSAMDMLFLSSETEGLPNVLIEAQALGLPVATMNVGGAAEAILENVSGLKLEESEPEGLAKRILLVLQNPDRLLSMQHAGAEFVTSRFERSRMIAALKKIYESNCKPV